MLLWIPLYFRSVISNMSPRDNGSSVPSQIEFYSRIDNKPYSSQSKARSNSKPIRVIHGPKSNSSSDTM